METVIRKRWYQKLMDWLGKEDLSDLEVEAMYGGSETQAVPKPLEAEKYAKPDEGYYDNERITTGDRQSTENVRSRYARTPVGNPNAGAANGKKDKPAMTQSVEQERNSNDGLEMEK